MDKFFDAGNPVMRFLSRLVDLAVLNMITLIYSIPLVTAGGALTAMSYVLLHIVRGDETYVIRMFRKSFKENFRQGIPLGLLTLAAVVITAVDLWALHGSESGLATLLMIIITVIALFLLITAVYVFALQSRYDNTVRRTILNAASLTVAYLPKTLGMAAAWIIWIAVLIYLHRAAPLVFIIYGLSLPGFICAMAYSRIFEKLEEDEERIQQDN